MKRNLLYLIISLAFTIGVKAQDVNYLLTEAAKLEKEMKDPEALKKYQEALQLSPTDVKALTKCSELNSLIGNRQTDKKTKQEYFNAAKTFAETALKVSDQDADANYTMALALAKYSASGSVKERMDAV